MSAPSSNERVRRSASALQLVHTASGLRVFARLLAAMLGALVVALLVVPWQQNVQGAGRVIAFEPFDRIQTLAAPVDGRVRKAWVIEGSRVQAGDPILEIVDNDPSILQRLEAQRSALEAQLDAEKEKVEVLDQQLEALSSAREMSIDAAGSLVRVATAAVRSAEHGVEAARATERQAELNFDRQRELLEEGLTSELEFEVAERVYLEAEARLDQALQALEAARNDEIAKRADLGRVGTQATAGIESAKAQRQAASVEVAAKLERLANLDTRIAQQNTQLVTAPRAGTVYRLFAAPGAELVKAGDPLVSLIPDTTSRAVELWIDGNDVPLIDPGRPVRLQFEGWPAIQFSGWPSVAVGTFGGKVALVDPTGDATGRFRILVVPDDHEDAWPVAAYLRQGVRANGFVLLDRVSLGYELWRQANAFPPTVAMGGAAGRAAESNPPPPNRGGKERSG